MEGVRALAVRSRETRGAVLESLRARLTRAGISAGDASVEAEALLCHALGVARAEFWCDPGTPLTSEELRAVEGLTARRERREPLQLLVGTVGFHELTLVVEPGVFIPRPETETLVEAVLEATPRASEGRLLDLGTGTGAAAIALLAALPGWTAVAIDRSPAAVALSKRNAALNGVASRFTATEGDYDAASATGASAVGTPSAGASAEAAGAPWLDRAPYDLVVSNPPYIPSAAIAGLMPEVRDHDPLEALDGGPDGLDAYRAIARLLPRILRREGLLAVEIGEDQADSIGGILVSVGTGAPANSEASRGGPVRRDLAGRPRVLLTTWRGGVA